MAQIQAVDAETRHAFSRHTHEGYGIGVMISGAQRSWSGRGFVEAGAGDVITVNPGEVHDGMPMGDRPRAWRMLYIVPSVIGTVIADMRDGRSADFEFSHPVMRDARHAARFERTYTALTDPHADAETWEDMMIVLLSQMMGTASPRPPKGVPSAIERARAMIDDRLPARVTLADLARETGMSRFQVLRGFGKLTGLTPHAYIIQRKVDAARRLIAKGAGLADAAAACGFADQSHLTRVFTRKYGLSPHVFARASR